MKKRAALLVLIDAGYRPVAIGRNTEIIGIVSFQRSESGGGRISEFEDCDSSGLSVY